MAKRKIELCDCAGEIVRALRPGILITTKAGGKVNSMTIGWGTLGIIWNRPVFIAFVRDCRYTREMLDKIAAAGLTPVEPEVISVPGLKEFPLTLECRVIYRQGQESGLLPDDISRSFYRMETAHHICFYGEVVASYMIE